DKGAPRRVWRRNQVEATSPPVPLQEGALQEWVVSPEQPPVVVRGLVRRHETGDFVVTVFLVNGQDEPERSRDEAWLFQPEVIVEGEAGASVFRRRPRLETAPEGDDPDAAIVAMGYRRQAEFAVGHGVAVHVDTAPGDPLRATRVAT